jgi:hypothetical protein
MQNILKAKSGRLFSLIGMIALVAIIGLSSVSCVINVPDDAPNYSLDGNWDLDFIGSGNSIRINGSTAVSTGINTTDPLILSAVNKGYFNVGSTIMRNITKTGDRTWTCQHLMILRSSANSNVAAGTSVL